MNQIFRFLETWFGTFRAATATSKPNFKNGYQVNGTDFVDSNKDVQLRAVDVGKSGTAGNIDIFPTTAVKGKFRLSCTDQTGDTISEVVMGAQAEARTYGIPDWSTSAAADTECSLAGIKVVANVTSRPGALGCLLYATGNNKLYVCTAASATAATWTIVGTQS